VATQQLQPAWLAATRSAATRSAATATAAAATLPARRGVIVALPRVDRWVVDELLLLRLLLNS
jgi:hypothetical protein